MVSYFFPPLFTLGSIVLLCTVIACGVDTLLLYSKKRGVDACRVVAERFSNGDENNVRLELENEYGFAITCTINDEMPYQFQMREWKAILKLSTHEKKNFIYTLKPQERGEYYFGNIIVFVDSPLGLVNRRYSFEQPQTVKVYPSYVQMRRYQLLAVANRLQDAGVKRTRRLGHSLEFEQIKDYVRGDDYRTINWKATARRGDLMVNNYSDERSQQIYCIVNKSRIMKMPFEGLSLLDYAINASLVISNVALMRQDRAGLITFAHNVDTFIPADKKAGQLNIILETLYKQSTQFLENDFEKLFSVIRNRITQRSLLMLFTNFETLETQQNKIFSSLKEIC